MITLGFSDYIVFRAEVESVYNDVIKIDSSFEILDKHDLDYAASHFKTIRTIKEPDWDQIYKILAQIVAEKNA